MAQPHTFFSLQEAIAIRPASKQTDDGSTQGVQQLVFLHRPGFFD
jgi:hypothetical protein